MDGGGSDGLGSFSFSYSYSFSVWFSEENENESENENEREWRREILLAGQILAENAGRVVMEL